MITIAERNEKKMKKKVQGMGKNKRQYTSNRTEINGVNGTSLGKKYNRKKSCNGKENFSSKEGGTTP
jgi:hypothetical protein